MTDSKTILLVEDEEGQAELIKRIFEMNAFLKTKWDIHHVSNLKDAFKCLDNDNPPSAIIADYCLPDGEGLDLTRGAKKPEDVGIPVIILTAYGTEELAVRSLKSGAMDYVVKTTERFRELPWIVERTLREWENIVRERRIEEDLQESRQQYYELVEGVNSVILRMNAKGTITFFNRFAKELFGYTRDEIIGRDIVGTIVPETESTGRDLKEMILEIGRNPAKYKNNVNENVKKNGERLWINWTNKPVLDEEGQVVEIMCIGNDITDIREMEEDLKVKNAEMERFVYTVSHDLRSPLVTISGFTGMLKKDIESNERKDIETDLLMIGDAVEKMDHLLRDTLELSRIGRIVNPPEDVSFKEIVKDALDQISGEIGSKEKDIEISLEDSISKKDKIVHVDRMRIVEVLVNLIGNSIKYMGDQVHPKIEIGYLRDENVFFVRDNGIGIPPDQHEKVFQLFYKIDKKSKGSGAGLAIVKRIVEVHGGKIWIESEGKKGEGSTFCFTLPEPE
jgi:PAS domain S-box-containing protein